MSVRVPEFSKLVVAVAGDLVADHYLFARPARLSREAPVMVLRHERDAIGAGGAANVARNLRALGADVHVFGALGRDASGREVLRLLEAEGIDVSGVVTVAGWTTPTKTRVLAAEPRRSPHQVLRIDREPDAPLDEAVRIEIGAALERLASASQRLSALLVSDYEYGSVGVEVARVAARMRADGRVSALDPRRDLELFRGGLSALTPNVGELASFTRRDPAALDDVPSLRAAAAECLALVEPRWLLVTRGNLGMALFGEGIPSAGIAVEASGDGEVTDVSGAGDTAAAVFTLALAARVEPAQAMVLANAAAGVVVMENGAAVCPVPDLLAALETAPSAVRLATR